MPVPHGGRLVDRVVPESEGEALLEQAQELPRILLEEDLQADVENIAFGILSPLEGFLGREDFGNVVRRKRLSNDLPWTIPIVLDVGKEQLVGLSEGDDVALAHDGSVTSVMHVEEIYAFDPKEMAGRVYGTTDPAHPGVARTYGLREFLVGGKLDLIRASDDQYRKYRLRPVETRVLFREKGWRTVVGFQTRNVPHLGHEYVQKTALTFVDGVFVNPVIGRKKAGDFKDEVILEAYDVLMRNYYLRERAVLAIWKTEMRYAGPREAIHHAIARKNFGCTHFIVGRDHAGVGNYYPPYAAQDIFEEFPDLGIVPLFFRSFYYCKRCGSVVNEKICPHGEDCRIEFSGTRLRQMLARGEKPPLELMRPEVFDVVSKWADPFN